MTPELPAVAPAAFQDVLASMAEVDRLKSREELLAIEADLPARVADVAARLKKAYAQQGVAVPDHLIEQGVAQFFSQRLVFAPPPPTLGARFAPLWIFRVRILAAGAIFSALFLAIVTLIYLAVIVPAEQARERERVAAQAHLEDAAVKLDAAEKLGVVVFSHMKNQLEDVREHAPEPELVNAVAVAETKVAAAHTAFDENLQRARAAVAPFAPIDHLAAARAQPANIGADEALNSVQAAGQSLAQVSSLSDQLGALQAERASLEAA
ncbi:MAG: hypothetical protein RIQ79_53, partial [Verrucomicrobiota bacterium]